MFSSLSIVFAQKHIASNTLEYSYLSFHKEHSDSLNGQNYTVKILFNYPIITNNDTLMKIVSEFVFKRETPPSNLDSYIQKRFSGFKKTLIAEGYVAPYYENHDVRVIYNQSNLLSLMFKEVTSWGQIHPLTVTKFKCFQFDNSRQLKLSDLFQNDYYKELLRIAENQIYIQLKLDKTKSLNEQGFWFKDNKFVLNDNFYINTDGLHFYYNHFDIRAYGYGTTDLVIPWSKIKHLINEDILNRI